MRAYCCSVFVVCVALLVGCGSSEPKRYRVTGSVKYKGEPIKLGAISFRADNGATGGGQITNGQYDIPGAAGLTPGKYRVAITYPDPKTPAPRGDEPPGVAILAKEILPDKYNNQTTLTAEIKPESTNVINFDDLK
ncbi:hypothetical protein FRUB_05624 [Fimbriiglobus ruber]|uniref:Carboxypeptidase regulatory-like domain-containing protein n=2 Tax=Fimbriiglobus ruber TaxID=1908690 RepID=A0A225DJ54_9BACT|nr:hypothetical protein FRUB_05624 [Fimbriiglobus ruber]